MIDELHFRKLENMYRQAPCNKYFSPGISIGHGEAEIKIPVRSEFFHAAGAVHGATYFKALDDAAFFSANSLVEKVFVLTSNYSVHFIRPVSAGVLRAVGKVVNTTRSQLLAEAILYDSKDMEIARGIGSFIRSNIKLTEEIGYR